MRTIRILALSVAALLAAGDAGAQAATPAGARTTPKVFSFTPYAGYVLFGNFLEGPLGTSLGLAAAPMVGAQLGLKVAPNISLYGNIASANGDLEVGVPIFGGINAGSSRVILGDGGLQLDLPLPTSSRMPITPWVQAGLGGVRYDLDIAGSLIELKASNFATAVGAGLDLGLGGSFALRFTAKDYIGKFDFEQATALPVDGGTKHNWALSAGLRVDF